MNDQQGRVVPSRPIPKRPSAQPGQSPSLPKRSILQSELLQSIPTPLPAESEQSPILETPSSAQLDDVNSGSEQSPILAAPSSDQAEDGNDPSIESPILATPSSDDVDARSLFAEMATVKRVALAPKASLEGKSRPTLYPAIVSRSASRLKIPPERRSRSTSTPYPAMVSSKRGRKWNLFGWVTSFAFLK